MPQANPENGGSWGIMGGAFDPIHNAHLTLAESAQTAFNLNGVLFVPSFNPPHRESKPIVSFEQRAKMIKLAIENNNNFVLSRIESEIDGPGYSLTLIKGLKEKYPKANWYLILGADNIVLFDKWFKPKEILSLVTVVVGGRPGFNEEYKNTIWFDKVKHFEMRQSDLSSTTIRELLKQNKPITGKIPHSVEMYIREQGLYK